MTASVQSMIRLIHFRLCSALCIALLAGCSAVYRLKAPPTAVPEEVTSYRARLEHVLEVNGYETAGPAPSRAYECDAPGETVVFVKFTHDPRDSRRVRAIEYACPEAWSVVVMSTPWTTNAGDWAAELRDALEQEFAAEIAVGALRFETRHRVPLE